jgi:hypothetical protein
MYAFTVLCNYTKLTVLQTSSKTEKCNSSKSALSRYKQNKLPSQEKLMHCASNRKSAGSGPDEVTEFCNFLHPSSRTRPRGLLSLQCVLGAGNHVCGE